MADRKARSVTFRTPERIGLGVMKEGIQKEIQDGIVVFQELGDNVYLLELQSRGDAELLVDNGFDVNEFHIDCSPPHGKFVNVSIMGLRSYVEDEEVKSVLSEYGELKSEVIRLKYKADHELAGFENGNRLVKIILEKPSIPYSLRIGGEWCRIIHNNQQPVCKRQLTTDSDSDCSASTRRTRLRPAPSLSTRRKVEKTTKATKGSDKPPSK